MSKYFKLVAILSLLAITLVACGTTPAPTTEAPAAANTEVPVVEATQAPVQPTAVPQADRVQIYWYIGLGAGAQPAQIPLEKAWVDKYNKSQDKIQVIPIIVDNKFASDNLTAQFAADNAPDIVGPVGTEGRASFPGAWADMTSLVKDANYDTSDIDPAFIDFYKSEGKLEGLPFAIFPSAMFYNKALFDEAKLAYPPQKVGDKYKMPDGTEVEWNFDTVAAVAKLLTVDKKGNDATSASFDKNSIVQYGFEFQWVRDNPRWFSAYFQPWYPADGNKAAAMPDAVKASIHYYYDAQFGKQPFEPTQAALDSDLLKGNAFGSGKVAMALTHLWYTCCIDPKVIPSWDAGVAPSYNGKTWSKMHGDTFAITAASKHPKEAFEVYKYMLGEGSADLYKIYGGLPARKTQQADFFAGLDKTFAPNKVNWQVFIDMIPFMDVPNHQLGLPNNAKANAAFNTFGSDLRSNPKLDVDKRIADFMAELDTIFAEQPTKTP